MARKYDIIIDKGAKFELVIGVEEEDGTPRDLTGYTGRMAIRRHLGSATTEIDLSSPASGVQINAALGLITISMTDEQTDGLTIRSGVYDLKIESSGGLEERVLQGGVVLSPQVTE